MSRCALRPIGQGAQRAFGPGAFLEHVRKLVLWGTGGGREVRSVRGERMPMVPPGAAGADSAQPAAQRASGAHDGRPRARLPWCAMAPASSSFSNFCTPLHGPCETLLRLTCPWNDKCLLALAGRGLARGGFFVARSACKENISNDAALGEVFSLCPYLQAAGFSRGRTLFSGATTSGEHNRGWL